MRLVLRRFIIPRGCIVFLFCLVFVQHNCRGQEIDQYNINIYSDLPSNLVYNLMVDHNGYLWIATEKGVLRYNGYSLNNFNFTKGFINKEIWNLYEDKKGRMWLYSISDNVGFIYKNQYRNLIINTSPAIFYPRFITDYSSGICFVTAFMNNQNDAILLCLERNDSLTGTYDISQYGVLVALDSSRTLIAANYKNEIYRIGIVNNQIDAHKAGNIILSLHDRNRKVVTEMVKERYGVFQHYIYSYKFQSDSVKIIDVNNHEFREYSIEMLAKTEEKESLTLIFSRDNMLALITNKSIYYIDSNLNLAATYRLEDLIGNLKDVHISFFVNNPFWGNIISTYTSGVYMCYKDDHFQKTKTFGLDNFQYIGSSSDSVCYWWNSTIGIMAKIENNRSVTYKNTNIQGNAKVIAYNKDSSLFLCPDKIYKMDNRTMATDLFINSPGYDAVAVGKDDFFILSKFSGFYHFRLSDKNDLTNFIDKDRYREILFDSTGRYFLVYNDRKILLYKSGGKQIKMNSRELEALGINSIQKVLIDNKYRNLFVKEEKRLLLISGLGKHYTSLFNNYVLDDAKVFLKNGLLVVAGEFGILFSKIEGNGKISAPVVYPNVKKLKYSIVYDAQVSGDKVLLKTDKGEYLVNIPVEEYRNTYTNTQGYKLIVQYDNDLYNLQKRDFINIRQKEMKLMFDLIRPAGIGRVKYLYRISHGFESWREMSNNELTLPKLNAGEYYTLSLIVSDAQWRSNPINIHLYILPFWWEKPLANRLIWSAVIIFLGLFIYTVVIITKREVIRKNAKKNLRLELELKSIYSQINPHFIFNSLGSAMYLIKTKKLDEAYDHIHKFSHLLRSYIKSSRNRFILLSEEIGNLKNYIELQQVRFNNKFDYEIIVDNSVKDALQIPSLLLQPFVENAIRHGLLNKEGKGRLGILFKWDAFKKEIICTIEDDGIGRVQSKLIKDETVIKEESYGDTLIRDLVGIFNRYEKMNIEIEYIDKESPLTGTIVKLSIKDINE